MKKVKMNVLLAKTDHLSSSYKKLITDYISYFKNHQGAFQGEKKTYTAKDGQVDEPSMRGNKLIVTTVGEKLAYLQETVSEYIDALFSQEKTNASGKVVVELVVEGISFGTFSSLELLRLKSLLEHNDFEALYSNIPVRSDSEIWNPTTSEEYKGREGILETKIVEGVKKTTLKESYILQDPNIGKIEGAKYTPQVAQKDTLLELGNYTSQKFSGETSHAYRADILRRRTRLLTAVIEAIKEANEVESVQSDMNSKKLFSYLHTGKIA